MSISGFPGYRGSVNMGACGCWRHEGVKYMSVKLSSILGLILVASTFGTAQSPVSQGASTDRNRQPLAERSAKSTEASNPIPSPAVPKSAMERFPYPGEAPPQTSPDKAAVPTTQTPDSRKQFPYPGDSSTSSTRSSNSSYSGSRSSDPAGNDDSAGDDVNRQGSARRKLPKVKQLQSDEDRESEDLTVAQFYRQSGNLQAAYLRARDAVMLQPGDPDAHLALADIAQHLKKKEEAVTEYNTYLKLEPDGDRVKAVEKALLELK